MNDPPDGDVLSLNADILTLTAECNHVLYKPCIVININKPHLETGDAAFAVAAPRLWNALPHALKSVASINIFKTNLKTHLFIC